MCSLSPCEACTRRGPGLWKILRRCRVGRELVFLGGRARVRLDATKREYADDLHMGGPPSFKNFWHHGQHGQEIDHIELFGPPLSPGAHSKNFVLCPGKAYDRSPCGTGTSAKMACLYADGKLREGEVWVQESILGSTFEGSIRICDERLYPSIKGAAFVNAEATMVEPNLRSGTAGGLLVREDAVLYSQSAAHYLMERAQALGAECYTNCAVSEIGNGSVITRHKEFTAAAVVNETGAWAPVLTPKIPVKKRKGHLVIYRLIVELSSARAI